MKVLVTVIALVVFIWLAAYAWAEADRTLSSCAAYDACSDVQP